ncbi:MAG: HD domain-containing phosphohydrolase [Desulfobacterales bacterium]
MPLKYKHTIMTVDDEADIIKALQRLFRKENYRILSASSAPEGLDLLKSSEKPVSLIISDQRMPEMSGSQFLEQTRKIFPNAIRFLLTGYSDMDAVVDAINNGGIHRYLSKPWNDEDLKIQVRQSLEHYELAMENKRLEGSLFSTVKLLSSLIETLNPMLGTYMKQVGSLSRTVAEDYELPKEELDQIEIAGMIHDIGLLGVPEHIILKDKEEMTQKEFMVFSQHPTIGKMCLEAVEYLDQASLIVLHHHEYYDGTGFPHNLRREEIPLGSRIIGAVADYSKIIYTWPKNVDEIAKRARNYLGPAANNIDIDDPEKMLTGIAKKIILLSAEQKYDVQVVSTLMKKLGEKEREESKKRLKILSISVEELKEGMVLAKNLRSKDGRILLQKDAKIKESSIETIQTLVESEVVENEIFIILTSEEVDALRQKKIEAMRNRKKILLIPLEELNEGMLLAKNLRSKDGRILVPKGKVLKESAIKTIQQLGERGIIQDKIHVTV